VQVVELRELGLHGDCWASAHRKVSFATSLLAERIALKDLRALEVWCQYPQEAIECNAENRMRASGDGELEVLNR